MRFIKYIFFNSFIILTLFSYSQNLVCDSIKICGKTSCDTVYIGKTTVVDIENKFGEGIKKINYEKFHGHVHRPIYKKVVQLLYNDLGLRFQFESGYNIKKEAKKCDVKLNGFTCLTDHGYYFNDSINMGLNKKQVDSIIELSDTLEFFKPNNAPVYFYFNKGLQIQYTSDNDNANILWLYYYETDQTQNKNIVRTDIWLKENGLK
jgi:hypothetical protein